MSKVSNRWVRGLLNENFSCNLKHFCIIVEKLKSYIDIWQVWSHICQESIVISVYLLRYYLIFRGRKWLFTYLVWENNSSSMSANAVLL